MSESSIQGIQGQSQSPRSHRRTRKPVSCDHCRYSKLRCDRQQPCGSCKRRGREASCLFPTTNSTPGSATAREAPPHSRVLNGPNRTADPLSTPRKQPIISSPGIYGGRTQPAPNESFPDGDWGGVLERPVPNGATLAPDTLSPYSIGGSISPEEILDTLPPEPCCDYLVSYFFTHISELFPILHGPTFEGQYIAFRQQPHQTDMSWLALLFSMCALTLSATEPSDPRLGGLALNSSLNPTEQIVAVTRKLQQTAMVCLLQDHFFTRYKLNTFEALLMLIYNQSHNESVDQGWALLGMALNIGIALRCNIRPLNISPVEIQRWRRCWAGLLTLHTYQAILFRDVDMTFLLDIEATTPANVNDSDIVDEGVLRTSSEPTQMSLMIFKLRLFPLSTQICRHISGSSRLEQGALLKKFDGAIAEDKRLWDATYMIKGSQRVLNSYYAHRCILQTYAHHLTLLLHRPFHNSQTPHFIPESREKCITSAAAMISIHKQLYEVPLLRNFSWLLNGVTSLKALHAAVALNSCLRDIPSTFDATSYREDLENLTFRMESLSARSKICLKAYHVLRHLQAHTGRASALSNPEAQIEGLFEDWTDVREWFDDDLINWNLHTDSYMFTD